MKLSTVKLKNSWDNHCTNWLLKAIYLRVAIIEESGLLLYLAEPCLHIPSIVVVNWKGRLELNLEVAESKFSDRLLLHIT